MKKVSETPVPSPYSYGHLDEFPVELNGVSVSYPLVLYFASDAERAAFARELRQRIKDAGWLVGHLKRSGRG